MLTKRQVVLTTALVVAPVALLVAPRLAAQSVAQHTQALKAGIEAMQGTWTLALRTAPDGSPHAQPLQGTTVIKLNMNSGNSGAPATGTLYSVERGVLDAVVCACGCGCAAADSSLAASKVGGCASATANTNQLFEMEATSDLELQASPESTESGATLSLTHKNLYVKGTYGVFRNGIRTTRLQNTFRLSNVASAANASRNLAVAAKAGAKQMSMVVEPQMNVSRFGGAGSLLDKSHQFKSLTVAGDRMDITWGNGAKDIWIRTGN